MQPSRDYHLLVIPATLLLMFRLFQCYLIRVAGTVTPLCTSGASAGARGTQSCEFFVESLRCERVGQVQVRVVVEGALGVRTDAQATATAQLVARLDRRGGAGAPDTSRAADGAPVEEVRPRLPEGDSSWAGWQDDSGVHATPLLTGAGASSSVCTLFRCGGFALAVCHRLLIIATAVRNWPSLCECHGLPSRSWKALASAVPSARAAALENCT